MRRLAATALLSLLLGCVAPDPDPVATTSSLASDAGATSATSASGTWTDTAMQNLVATKCATAGCHDTQVPTFVGISESDMKSNAEALVEVQLGAMPKDGPLDAADLAIFEQFYGQ